MSTGLYLIELVDHAGEPLAELAPRQRRLTLGRRARAALTFTLDLDEAGGVAELLALAEVDVRVTYAGEPLMCGPLAAARVSLGATSGAVTFAATGVRELLGARILPAGYSVTALEQATAAWQLIEHAQGLEGLGITAGALPASVARTKEWTTRASVLSALEELADLEDGFDYDLVPLVGGGHRFDVYPGEQATPSPLVLDYGRTVAAVNADVLAGAGDLVNEAIVAGAGGVEVAEDDPASVTLYRLRQRALQLPDADDATALGAMARAELARNGRPRGIPRLTLAPGHPEATLDSVRPGLLVQVEVRRGWYQLEGAYVVDEVSATLTDEGAERLEVIVAEPLEAT